jgi:periplasmic protein TonB
MRFRLPAAMIAQFLFIAGVQAQVDTLDALGVKVVTDQVPDEGEGSDDVFMIVEEMPQFPGGQEGLFKFLAGNIRYPEEAVEAGIEGTVYVTFVVGKDGSIGEARVLRGIGGGCDEESLRVVNAMPNWRPGFQRGKPVLVQYNLPIRYTLASGDGGKQ